jgi:hypothetical protein
MNSTGLSFLGNVAVFAEARAERADVEEQVYIMLKGLE